jgi:hypothetical protein
MVAGAAAGLALARMVGVLRLRGRRARARTTEGADGGAARADLFRTFPCKLGDVLIRRAELDEVWLAGALVLSEERPVAVLFVAPEAGGDRAVFVRASSTEVEWLRPMPLAASLAVGRDPPGVWEDAGTRLDRKRRLPVRIERLGTGAPDLGATAVVAEYGGPGIERFLILAGARGALAWRGVELTADDYDVLPGAD